MLTAAGGLAHPAAPIGLTHLADVRMAKSVRGILTVAAVFAVRAPMYVPNRHATMATGTAWRRTLTVAMDAPTNVRITVIAKETPIVRATIACFPRRIRGHPTVTLFHALMALSTMMRLARIAEGLAEDAVVKHAT